MAEMFGNLLNFVGTLAAFFWEMLFVDTLSFIKIALDGPFSHPFETIVSIMLLSAALTMVIAVLGSIFRFSFRPFVRVIEAYIRFFGFIGSWIVIFLIVGMVYEVISRYFFDQPTQWAFEVAYMLMGTSFMFGIALCMQTKRHIRVDFLYDNIGNRGRAVVDLIGYALLIPMLFWLCGGLWEYFHAAYKVDETSGESAWNPIIWPFKFVFVMGFLLLFMQTVVEVLKSILALVGLEVPESAEIEGLE